MLLTVRTVVVIVDVAGSAPLARTDRFDGLDRRRGFGLGLGLGTSILAAPPARRTLGSTTALISCARLNGISCIEPTKILFFFKLYNLSERRHKKNTFKLSIVLCWSKNERKSAGPAPIFKDIRW